jgi:RND family efflux transporter MFP subunit
MMPMPTRMPPLLLCAFALLAACQKGGEEGGTAGGIQPVVGAKTDVVRTGPFTEMIGAIGAAAARPGRSAALSAPTATRIVHVYVSAGAHVKVGEALVEFDQTSFRAATLAANAALAAAERAEERARRLVTEGIVPRKDLDQATSDLAKARADAATARRAEELSVLRSPIAGVVTRMAAVLGASVDPNQPLVEIADPSALDLIYNVTPTDAARIHPGAKVTLTAGQSATGEALGIGTVVDVGGAVDSASRSVAVRAQAPATRRPLRIGETVFGQIAVATHANAIIVPLEALVPEGDGFKVFVVDAAGIAHARPVNVGGRTDKLAEILSGLSAGERIVTYGAYGVEDSVKIAPLQPTASPTAPAGATKS